MMDKYKNYEIFLPKKDDNKWSYVIYAEKNSENKTQKIISDEYFSTAQEARFAAIGHIHLLENGDLK